MTWLRKHWVLIAILALALVLRMYRIGETMTFLEDEGRDLLIVKRMLDTGRPVLLGPQTSMGNMYLGPLYYYFITPALALAGMNPIGPASLLALSGVLTTYLLFWLGKKWFSPTSGYLAAGLFATLPFSVSVTRASWNPNLVPLVATLMLISYHQLVFTQSRLRNWLIYGGLIGIMVQLHYMTLIFCGVMSLSVAWSYRTRPLILVKGMLFSLIGGLITLSPFILFEARNNWVNTHAITRFMEAKEGKNIRYNLPVWLWWNKVQTTSYRLMGKTLVGSESTTTPTTTVVVIGYFALLFSALASALKSKNRVYSALVVILLASLAILGIYQENIHLHYLEFMLPLIILTIAGFFQLKLPSALAWLGTGFVLLVVSLGFVSTLHTISSGQTFQARKAQEVADYIVQQAGDSPYNVVSTQGMYTTPFQYYLAISPHPPVNVLAPRVFDICAGSPCPDDDATTTLLFLTGPGHPSISAYLGHPELNLYTGTRRIVRNEHVSLGIWVAEIVLE